MALELATVAFLDILGFSEMVEHDANSSTPEHLERLLSALEVLREEKDKGLSFSFWAFSDSIILASPFDPCRAIELMERVGILQRSFLRHSIPLRGGIAFGKHYSDDRIVYSKAAVRAYEIETGVARVPRVVVDENIIDCLQTHKDSTSELKHRLSSICLRDKDGKAFISYLNQEFMETHRSFILGYKGKPILQNPSVLEKVQWVTSYHNHMMDVEGLSSDRVSPVQVTFAPIVPAPQVQLSHMGQVRGKSVK